jgi:hypothetical protein
MGILRCCCRIEHSGHFLYNTTGEVNNMRRLKNCVKEQTCIDSICFDNAYDASKYLLKMAALGQPVKISRRTDSSTCFKP